MRWIKELPNNEINNLSPLVVSNPKIPLRGLPPGTNFSQITIYQQSSNKYKKQRRRPSPCHPRKSKAH